MSFGPPDTVRDQQVFKRPALHATTFPVDIIQRAKPAFPFDSREHLRDKPAIKPCIVSNEKLCPIKDRVNAARVQHLPSNHIARDAVLFRRVGVDLDRRLPPADIPISNTMDRCCCSVKVEQDDGQLN